VHLLLSGGLTTRPAATQIAGRGVGLDLVRSIVSRLHGGIALANTPGRGVQVELQLPVSLRSLRYLRLESGAAAALLPLDAIRGTLRLADAALGVLGGQAHVTIDGAAVPLVSVDDVLTGETSLDARVAVVLTTGDTLVALAGQQFGETAETIAQALPPLSGAASVIRGLALDADGRILPVLEPSALAGRTSSVAPSRPPNRERRILVIDDSVTTRMLEESILEAAGFAVDVAASAEEALICAASATYDLFIVDVEMPGMNGFEFVAATRQDEALARTPAILVTSRGSDEDRQRGADAGARGYIVKGEFDQETFLGLVRRLVA
jgi:two-component system chemotaxis sensor kinase CheA